MNTDTVRFQLKEASIHLSRLVAEFDDGKICHDDAPALAVELAHIFDHIAFAWNARELSPDQVAQLSQDKFTKMCNSLPNFLGEKELGDVAI